ncbi:interferon-inducible GTPase 5-like [Hemicordylus capensis]|uniref:interferon-inducible GTPase 5-like n=1 Tax=Hemicordylus capensis TaxID=884348 RepID=UPI00230276B8|nr:interferon-inducible GTPase 5-like [Hemicordylus capensis]XP_053123409.1 interferon-inducible GTPase 5-like [Hemicordylus capensis]
MDEFKAAVYQGNLTGAVFSVLAKPLQSFSDIPLHVGVVGEPGSGKSSFINAMLGLSEGDPGAAQTGIQMTTVEAKDYPYPLLPQVILWDLPGKGASPFGEGIRAKQVDLSRFDFFIIVGTQRFRTTHSDLAHEIQGMGKRFYFVRTKADLDLEASRRQRPSGYSEEKVLQRIKEDCRECLIREGMRDPQVFLVSNWETRHFDFPLLRDKLEKDLSGLKRQAFLHKLPTACLPTLEKMQAAKKIWLTAMCSGVMAAIPVPGLSFLAAMFLFTRFRSQCHLDFGLDDPSLSALAQLVGKPTAAFKAVMKSLGIKPAVWWRLPDVVGAAVMIQEYYYWRGFPIFGCVLSGGISLLTTYFMLRKCISDVAKDTQRVLTKALEAEEKKSI